jgi:hypothetical protein
MAMGETEAAKEPTDSVRIRALLRMAQAQRSDDPAGACADLFTAALISARLIKIPIETFVDQAQRFAPQVDAAIHDAMPGVK